MSDQGAHAGLLKKILVITVHGTWAAGRDDDEPKWWERCSKFISWLCDEFQDAECEIEEFMWSGANSDKDRTVAARNLAKCLRDEKLSLYDEVHIIAHSHGGNVAELAIKDLCMMV